MEDIEKEPGTKKSDTEETLQSIDNTLKRIEQILLSFQQQLVVGEQKMKASTPLHRWKD